jgi:hypothetical protein
MTWYRNRNKIIRRLKVWNKKSKIIENFISFKTFLRNFYLLKYIDIEGLWINPQSQLTRNSYQINTKGKLNEQMDILV